MDKKLIINARKPKGELGAQLIERMNKSHESMANWGINHINIKNNETILDIGCGGGANVKKFSEIAIDGMVYGIDYSEVSVEKSKELNQSAITKGKVKILQASVSNLPFEDNTFNIITGFETTYFWPDFQNDLKEIYRVLKPKGKILISNTDIGDEENLKTMKEHIELLDMKLYNEEEYQSYLSKAGFKDIKIFRKEKTKWVCVIGFKG